ncbi:MAG: asparagine synthase (glutamine-hydrolyzing) [Eubacteriales bacterium]|nr:asparagine synthase (glutamine-hydrolyzing) [Eubacteriales bacterium]MDD4474536.1 asparagine synthase (glutamine-hydrolyzing) [Eubacteriales bacterium]
MCGIAGIVGRLGYETDESVLENMRSGLLGSVPLDQKAVYRDTDAALIQTCATPQYFERGTEKYVIVKSGELYNASEIRKLLSSEGYSFDGNSDEEVMLKAYVCWGQSCTDKFDGDFAIAIWESHNKKMFLVRDKMGIRPLFYAVRQGSLIFASELKALLCHPSVKPDIDSNSIAEIMLIGPGRTPNCGIFKDVFEVPRAHQGYFEPEGSFNSVKYWSPKGEAFNDCTDTAIDKVYSMVEGSIKRQLISDEMICGFLSGGLDSSIIAAVSARHYAERGEKLRTFSVNYSGNDKNFKASRYQPTGDAEFIKLMVEKFGLLHEEIMIDTLELVDALYDAVEAREMPGMADVDSSLLLFCRAVKKHCNIALSGECSDEIFGGYPWYSDEKLRSQRGFPWSQSTEFRASFIKPGMLGTIDPYEFMNEKYDRAISEADITGAEGEHDEKMRKLTQINLDHFMQTLLDRNYRMSSNAGLEVRVPFCDYRIAEYLYNVPRELKFLDGMEKGLLRKAFSNDLPEKIVYRKKSPYPKTHNPDFLKSVTDRLNDVIETPSSPLLSILDKNKLSAFINEEGRETPWYGQLMQKPQTIAYFLQINHWMKVFKINIT